MLDLAQVAEASQKLTSLLDSVLAYVEDVLAGRTQPDNAVGRALLDMVNSVPKMTPEEFENMFNSNIKVGQKVASYTGIYSYVVKVLLKPT
jgi:translation initiation factor 3 subunit F